MSDPAFDYAPVGLALLEHRIIKRCNLQFADTFGATPAELCELPIAALYPSVEDYQRIGEILQMPESQSGFYHDERIMRRTSGALFWCRVRGRSLDGARPFQSGVWSFADLSDERPVVSLTQREREVAILTYRGVVGQGNRPEARSFLSHG